MKFAQACALRSIKHRHCGAIVGVRWLWCDLCEQYAICVVVWHCQLNENSQGNGIVLAGATYSDGLGMLGNSSVSLTLNGQYTRFESTIGVDGSSNSGSSVIFDVYGDGQLLYQSPTLTYNSGAIPIDVSVSGVTTLVLTVSAAPGSTPSVDNAVWADARWFPPRILAAYALYIDLAAFPERYGHIHANDRLVCIRRPERDLYPCINCY